MGSRFQVRANPNQTATAERWPFVPGIGLFRDLTALLPLWGTYAVRVTL